MQVLYIYCDFHSSLHTASDMSIIISKQYNETRNRKIYDQEKFVQDMTYLNTKSEENETNYFT